MLAAAHNQAGLNNVPTEIIANIFTLLPLRDRGRLAQVSKLFAHVARTQNVFSDLRYTVVRESDIDRVFEHQFCEVERRGCRPPVLTKFANTFRDQPYWVRALDLQFFPRPTDEFVISFFVPQNFLGAFQSLTSFNISSCTNHDGIPLINIDYVLSSLVNLEYAGISDCRVTVESKLTDLGHLHKLTCLRLREDGLTTVPASILTLPNIQHLDISHNELVIIPPSICTLWPQLNVLELEHNDLTFLPDAIVNLKQLHTLYLLGNYNLEALPDSFGDLANLKVLTLGFNDVMTALPDSFCRLTKLGYLDLSAMNALERLPQDFGRLTALTYLTMEPAIQTLPESFPGLSNLVTWEMRESSLTALPRALGPMTRYYGCVSRPENECVCECGYVCMRTCMYARICGQLTE